MVATLSTLSKHVVAALTASVIASSPGAADVGPLRVSPQTAAWSRAQNLRAGQEIKVIVDGSGVLPRVFLGADDTSLVVLDQRALPAEISHRLVALASSRPGAVAALLRHGVPVTESDLALTPDAIVIHRVFVASTRDVLSQFDRTAVVEITVDGRTVRDRRGRALGWAGLGAMVIGGLAKDPEGGPSVGWFVGMPLLIAGLSQMHGESAREGVIYRRPG
jgi:hypothetical protein